MDYYPYLPLPVCDMLAYMDRMGVDANTAIFLIERGGLVGEGLLVLGLMQRFGLSRGEAEKVVDDFGFLRVGCAFDRCADYDEFVRLLLGFGVASLGVAESYKVGEPINIAYDLVDFQGDPVLGIGAWVTLVQIHDGGHQTVWRWGATPYNPETGKQELSISTSGLPAGNYELIIGFKDCSHEKLVTKLVLTE